MGIMNSLSTTFSSALQQRLHMAHHNKRPTVSSYEINIAVRLLLHGSSLLDAAGVNANFSRIMSIVSSKAQWRRAFRQHETVEPLMRSDRNALTGGEDDQKRQSLHRQWESKKASAFYNFNYFVLTHRVIKSVKSLNYKKVSLDFVRVSLLFLLKEQFFTTLKKSLKYFYTCKLLLV